MPLLRQRPQGLRHQGEALDPDRDFPGLGFEQRALRPHDVAEIELLEGGVGFLTYHVLLQVELDLPLLIEELDELALPHVPDGHEPAGYGHGHGVVLAFDMGRDRVTGKVGRREVRAKRVAAGGAQFGQLLPPDRVLVMGDVGRKVAHGTERPTVAPRARRRKRILGGSNRTQTRGEGTHGFSYPNARWGHRAPMVRIPNPWRTGALTRHRTVGNRIHFVREKRGGGTAPPGCGFSTDGSCRQPG